MWKKIRHILIVVTAGMDGVERAVQPLFYINVDIYIPTNRG